MSEEGEALRVVRDFYRSVVVTENFVEDDENDMEEMEKERMFGEEKF